MQVSECDSKTSKLEPVWHLYAELADRDDSKVREAVIDVARLTYGNYDSVCFEGATGIQYFRPLAGSHAGPARHVVEMPVRILTFAIPRDPDVLARTIDAINLAHSYEEPVIFVTEAYAARARQGLDKNNPNRWWNRGFSQ